MCSALVFATLLYMAWQLLLGGGLMFLSILLCLWIQGEEPFAAAVFHQVRGELGACSNLGGRRWPLASGFSHVGLLLGRWFLCGSEAGDSGVTLVFLPQGFGQGLKHDSGHLHF